MRIFISSLIAGFEQFRDAAERGARTLGHDVIRVETFPAKSTSPQAACLAGVRDADAYALLMGEHYGDPQASGYSATHEEFLEARDRMPVFMFVQEGVNREPAQQRFLDEVRGWASGGLYKTFETADELTEAVVRALHDHEVANAAGPVDPAELAARALANLPDTGRGRFAADPLLAVSIAAGPHQQVLRPSEIEDGVRIRSIQREAMFGSSPVLDADGATKHRVVGSKLILEQEGRVVTIDQDGTIVIIQPVVTRGPNRVSAIVEESVRTALALGFRFAGWLLDDLDPVRRVTDVSIAVSLSGAGHVPWMKEHELASNDGSYSIGFNESDLVVTPTPPTAPRQSLLFEPDRLAEDITVLLRRSRSR